MFGKRKSVNDSFVMAMGKKAGNLKTPTKKPPKMQPPKNSGGKVVATAAVERVNARQKMGRMGTLTRELKNP